ncbi:MAG: hypothetical protein U9N83_05840 [Thermodesulfobacteriota bacterium]|nr:hypothetical protein [Thermodesulfobacteriota bacterium]
MPIPGDDGEYLDITRPVGKPCSRGRFRRIPGAVIQAKDTSRFALLGHRDSVRGWPFDGFLSGLLSRASILFLVKN